MELVSSTAIESRLSGGTLADGLVVDADHEIVTATISPDLPPLIAAVRHLKAAEKD